MGIEKGDTEERVVNAMANGIQALFKDNPGLKRIL